MSVSLLELAKVIRSKNAGPYEITLDILFKEVAVYKLFKKKKFITSKLIASVYNIQEKEVLNIIFFDPANAIKINLRRRLSSGSPGETDVYGAQQHVPLLSLEFDLAG